MIAFYEVLKASQCNHTGFRSKLIIVGALKAISPAKGGHSDAI